MKVRGLCQGRPALIVSLLCTASACNQETEFKGTSADLKNPQVISDQEFPAARLADGSAVYRPAFGAVDEPLLLQEKPPVKTDLAQIERSVGVDAFKQGHEGNLANEDFDVSKAGKVDLLVVIDDSDSMSDEQANLASKLSALTKHLKTTDWQVAVITTTSCALRNSGKTIKSSDTDAETAFANAVNVGTGGDGNERGILRAYQVFNGSTVGGNTCDNKWLRADASLAMLFVSDEESYCSTFDCPKGSKPEQLVELLTDTKANGGLERKKEMLKAYSITWDKSFPNCKSVNGESKGARYVALASPDMLNGISSSICDADYTGTLEKISKDVSRTVKREFDLKYEPALSDLNLTVDGVPFTDYQITGKKIKLNSIVDTALKLKVTYRYDAKPKFDKVVLTGSLDPSSIQVFVNNAVLPASAYDYQSLEKEVFFKEMPADNAEVKVKYRKNESLPDTFDLAGKNFEQVFERVEINGVATTAYQFDAVTEVLTFDQSPTDGALISLFSKSANPQILKYKVGSVIVLDKVREISATDSDTGEVIGVALEGGELTFLPDQVYAGRKVIVSFDYGDKDLVLQHELSHEPLVDTVAIDVVSGDEDCINSVRLEGKVLEYQCSGDELSEISVAYKYIAEEFFEFPVNAPLDKDTFVTVWIDGVRITDFTMNGNTVIVSKDLLDIDTVVRVIVTKMI